MKKLSRATLFSLFLLAAAIHLSAPALLIAGREFILHQGEPFRFKTQPVDPYDAFRGRYVALGFEQTTAPFPPELADELEYGRKVFAHIAVDEDGFAYFSSLSPTPPEDAPYLQVTYLYQDRDDEDKRIPRANLRLPFDRYYMDETLAPEAERLYAAANRGDGKEPTFVQIRIRNGQGVIEALYIEGVPARERIARARAES